MSEETKETKSKTGSKKTIIIAAVVIAFIAIVAIIIYNVNLNNKYNAFIEAGNSLVESKDYENALVNYESAISLKPKSPVAYLSIRDMYLAKAEDIMIEARTHADNGAFDEKTSEISIAEFDLARTSCDEAIATLNKAEEKYNVAVGAGVKFEENVMTPVKDKVNEVLEYKASIDNLQSNAEELKAEADALALQLAREAGIMDASVGDIVYIGSYEQDGDESNGPEAIEWDVLSADNNGILLVSHYVLDARPYNNADAPVTWEYSSLRAWLNNDFYNTAFSDIDKLHIETVNLANNNNEFTGIAGGANTNDNVFLLSVDDLLEYYDFNVYYEHWGSSEELMTEATQYAIDNGVWYKNIDQEFYDSWHFEEGYSEDIIGMRSAWWYTRTPGYACDYVCGVSDLGNTGTNFYYCETYEGYYGVRPAIYVNRNY